MLDPLQSLHLVLSRWCSQILDTLLAFLALAPFALVLAEARSPALLAIAPSALVFGDAR
jgi:hypothetical protein